MTSNETLAVMFTDICDSANVYRKLGDAEAHRLSASCMRLVVESGRRYSGRLIKTIGDGVMMTFPNAREAYRAALAIQLAPQDDRFRVKIGLHYGPVIETDGDVFGDTVNVAARLLARSAANEILMTRECVDNLKPEQRASVRLLDTTSVKGRPEWVEIYRAIGSSDDSTRVVPSRNPEDLIRYRCEASAALPL
jgi:adenylate cyclase